MKKQIKLALILFFLGCICCSSAMASTSLQHIQLKIDSLNSQCPQVINEQVQVDSITFLLPDTMQVSYTMFMTQSQVPPEMNNELLQRFLPALSQNVRAAMGDFTDTLLHYNLSMKMVFNLSDKKNLMSFIITPDMIRKQQEIPQETSDVNNQTLTTALQMGADMIKDRLPLAIDEMTTLIACRASNKSIIYTYQLEDSFVESVNKELFKTEMRGLLEKQTRSNLQLNRLLNMGANVVFVYKAKDKSVFADFVFTPQSESIAFDPTDTIDIGAVFRQTLIKDLEQKKKMFPITDEVSGVITSNCSFENDVLTYFIILPNSFFEKQAAETLKHELQLVMESQVVSDAILRNALRQGVTIKYVYQTSKNELFTEVLITPDILD